ncbi:bifunctional riboflavin kinase/FAD synthetase [Alkaliphilus crotonatoxidans]
MKLIEEIQHLSSTERAVALGNFDGLHIGHQKLIEALKEASTKYHLESCVYTFKNHTTTVTTRGKEPLQITSHEVKNRLFEDLGIETLVLAEFNEEIMNLSPEDFVKKILIESLNCKVAVVGFDYRFGSRAKGDVVLLKELGTKYGFSVCVIDPVTVENEKVSSTAVRKYILDGEIEKANQYLGRSFALYGKVIHGNGRGRNLGYPTANIMIKPHLLIPREGVYATLVKIEDKIFMGATCIGTNPTFQGEHTSVETFIIDYQGSLYDQYIEVIFKKRLRDNIRFDRVEGLIQQMETDVENTKKYLHDKTIMVK